MSNYYLSHTGAQLDEAIDKVLTGFKDVSGVTSTASDVKVGTAFMTSDGVLTEGTLNTDTYYSNGYDTGYEAGYTTGYQEGCAEGSGGESASGSVPVVNTITTSGTYDSDTYHADYYAAINSSGQLLLVVEGGTTTSYEAIRFAVSSVPSGVALYNQSSTSDISATLGAAYVAVFTGITNSVDIALNFSAVSSSNDYTTCSVTITYVD